MYLQDLVPLYRVRQWDVHFSVKAARPKQCWIQRIGQIGRRDDHYLLILQETIHLIQQLIQRLLLFPHTVHASLVSLAAESVNFVDEDHHGRIITTCLPEQISHLFGSETDIDLHKLTSGRDNEWDLGLSRSRFGDKGLARARWTVQQDTFGHAYAHFLIVLGGLDVIYDLQNGILGLFAATNIAEVLHALAFSFHLVDSLLLIVLKVIGHEHHQ